MFAGLVASLLIAWINFLTTSRWAAEPGALHGWRKPYYAAALAVASVLAVLAWRRREPQPDNSALPAVTFVGGALLLVGAYLSAFPPWSWSQVPFYDDWPGLMQLAATGVDLLRHGAGAGWNWDFLGGYQTSSDLSQSLALTGLVPMSLLGREAGFHFMLAAYAVLVPLAVFVDLRLDGNRRVTWLATGLACVLTAGFFGTVMRSGMANSVAGVGFSGLALAGSHAAQRGRRWGGPLMVGALTGVLYSHAAFFVYTGVLLGVEALYVRSWRTAFRSGLALVASFIGALPLHWELFQYPAFFRTNNLYWDVPPRFDWAGFVRGVYYAAEIVALPWRWFNDYVGAAHVWLPAVVVVAWRRRSRASFYAWATLVTVALLRLNTPQLGIVLAREMYLYPLLLAPALAALVAWLPARWPVGASLVLVIGLFVAVPFGPVRHVPDVRAFNPELVDRMRAAPGSMVLVENNPHWNMIATRGQQTERSRFGVHYEALLPEATGKRFFGQPQDGYHRSVFRERVVAGGGYRGRAIADTPPAQFAADLRRWGVVRLFVWAPPTDRYLTASAEFTPVWRQGDWSEFELRDADPRQVTVPAGTGDLLSRSQLGATVRLRNARLGETVVVRTNYFPAWKAEHEGRFVATFDQDGQLAFTAPASGDYDVRLVYPRRGWLGLTALFSIVAGAVALWAGAFSERPGTGDGRSR